MNIGHSPYAVARLPDMLCDPIYSLLYILCTTFFLYLRSPSCVDGSVSILAASTCLELAWRIAIRSLRHEFDLGYCSCTFVIKHIEVVSIEALRYTYIFTA